MKKGYLIVALIAIIGLSLWAYSFYAKPRPTEEHQWLIDNLTIYNVALAQIYQFELIRVSDVTSLTITLATQGVAYPRSEWVAYSEEDGVDTQAFVSVWGPMNNGDLTVEVARVTSAEIRIQAPDGRIWTMPPIDQAEVVSSGYLIFTITPP